MNNSALLSVILSLLVLLAGCASQGGTPAPENETPEPQVYVCADGTKVYDTELCPAVQPEPEVTEVECPDGSMAANIDACPAPALDCEDNNPCTIGFEKDGACAYEDIVDGTACGTYSVCMLGSCTEISPELPPVVTTPDMMPATSAELAKLRACDAFTSVNYKYTQNDAYNKRIYYLKLSNSRDQNWMVTLATYTDLPSLQYDRVEATDYRNKATCACNSRQLLIHYKAYGSVSEGEILSGGECGALPSELSIQSSFYDYVQDDVTRYSAMEDVSFVGYGGPAKHFYQETVDAAGAETHVSFYLADIMASPVMVNGTTWYADGTYKKFTMELQP